MVGGVCVSRTSDAASRLRALCAACGFVCLLLFGSVASAEPATIFVASTTSTQNSGLFDRILPVFEEQSGVRVKVVAVGTGQAIRLAKRGDADVLFVHDRASEEAFVREGFGVARHDVMYNDFVILGPAADPAGVRGMRDAAAALAKISERTPTFVTRGDDSGTHKAERRLWKAAGLVPDPTSGWYKDVGAGMGQALNVASELDAYVLSDRGTWLAFQNPGRLEVLVEGDPRLFNQYGVILVNPARYPHVKREEGAAFIAWLRSPGGQRAIGSLTRGGQALFTPNAKPGSPPEPTPGP